MNANSITERIREVLTHHPFDCTEAHVCHLAGGKLVATDQLAQEFLAQDEKRIMSALTSESGLSPSWRRLPVAAKSSTSPVPAVCYGACHIGPVVVVVAKPLPVNAREASSSDPIDSYFLDTVQVRVAEILGIDLTTRDRNDTTAPIRAADSLSEDLRLLDTFEPEWRRVYVNKWLAVKDGTVIAHGPTRQEVEQQVSRLPIKPPVLIVPPKRDEEVHTMFSIGI